LIHSLQVRFIFNVFFSTKKAFTNIVVKAPKINKDLYQRGKGLANNEIAATKAESFHSEMTTLL
jgi:hypothetical protein